MYNLKEFRSYVGITQTELAQMFGCTQPNIAKAEKLFSDLTDEQYKILVDKYGEELIHQYYITSSAVNELKSNIKTSSEHDINDLIFEQQKSISVLIDMVKKLQEENSKLTTFMLSQKIV